MSSPSTQHNAPTSIHTSAPVNDVSPRSEEDGEDELKRPSDSFADTDVARKSSPSAGGVASSTSHHDSTTENRPLEFKSSSSQLIEMMERETLRQIELAWEAQRTLALLAASEKRNKED